MSEFKKYLVKGLGIQKLIVDSERIGLMENYAAQLLIWNKKINLTAIKGVEAVAEKHFIDSISMASMINEHEKILDMGSGGGFPGVVLKIMAPSVNLVLVDSVRKKINFISHIIRTLDLQGIKAVHSRVEDLHQAGEYHGRFDAVVSRAFADLTTFVKLAAPFIRKGGRIIAMKGQNASKEILPEIRGQWDIETQEYELPFTGSTRYVLVLTRKNELSQDTNGT